MRGARFIKSATQDAVGIIPACAGSTPQMTHSISITWDHPRMCGEHIVKHVRPCSKRGSSPHVRGARIPSQRQGRLSGIIPACAGSTTGSPGRAHSRRDHPRMCGEHTKELAIGECTVGSSPHVRGARHSSHGYARFNRDHPRMCGEHQCMFPGQVPRRGSSPHVRGALQLRGSRTDARGIIPACAGSTSRPSAATT